MTEPIIYQQCTGPHCGRNIHMVKDQAGRRHPYDPPRRCEACGGTGRIELNTADLFEPDKPKRVTCKKCKGKGTITRSHFQTCPDAASFLPGGARGRKVDAT